MTIHWTVPDTVSLSICPVPPLQSEDANVTLIINSCRPGYSLRTSERGLAICVCVGAEDNPIAVLNCDDEDNTILLRVKLLLWASELAPPALLLSYHFSSGTAWLDTYHAVRIIVQYNGTWYKLVAAEEGLARYWQDLCHEYMFLIIMSCELIRKWSFCTGYILCHKIYFFQ